jgi:hypothetical protein
MLMNVFWPVVMVLVWLKFFFYELPHDAVLIALHR